MEMSVPLEEQAEFLGLTLRCSRASCFLLCCAPISRIPKLVFNRFVSELGRPPRVVCGLCCSAGSCHFFGETPCN